jgi:hypothetical protein
MSIKDLFRQRSDSIESLQEKYKAIEAKKNDLQKRADRLRAESLKSDIDVSQEIEEIQEEVQLADIALQEVKKSLEKMLEKKIASDYQNLNDQKLEFETKQADLAREAGTQLGEAVKTLQATNLSFATTLGQYIREQVIDFSNDHRRKNQMDAFLKSYSQEISLESDAVNFRNWKRELQKVEGLRPGTPDAQRHVEAKIKQLISA